MIFYEKDTKPRISWLYSKLPLNVLTKISDFGLATYNNSQNDKIMYTPLCKPIKNY